MGNSHFSMPCVTEGKLPHQCFSCICALDNEGTRNSHNYQGIATMLYIYGSFTLFSCEYFFSLPIISEGIKFKQTEKQGEREAYLSTRLS